MNEINNTRQAWECKIGVVAGVEVPPGGDAPMRRAVQGAFRTLTGVDAEFAFTGWGAKLTESELAVVENRAPRMPESSPPEAYAHLRAAFGVGCRIQAWHLNDGAANSNDGRWDTLTPPDGREPEFGCEPHLYRVHPEDLHILASVDVDEQALSIARRFTADSDPQTRAQLQVEIVNAVRNRSQHLAALAVRAIPFLEEVGNEFDDDGSNEPLELARDIRAAVGAE